jgi:hypothetical protein
MRLVTSAVGTKPTSRNVRCSVACGAKADIGPSRHELLGRTSLNRGELLARNGAVEASASANSVQDGRRRGLAAAQSRSHRRHEKYPAMNHHQPAVGKEAPMSIATKEPTKKEATMDGTAKIALLLIAVGLWANAAASLVRPVHAASEDWLSRLALEVQAMRYDFHDLIEGDCKNKTLCR